MAPNPWENNSNNNSARTHHGGGLSNPSDICFLPLSHRREGLQASALPLDPRHQEFHRVAHQLGSTRHGARHFHREVFAHPCRLFPVADLGDHFRRLRHKKERRNVAVEKKKRNRETTKQKQGWRDKRHDRKTEIILFCFEHRTGKQKHELKTEKKNNTDGEIEPWGEKTETKVRKHRRRN